MSYHAKPFLVLSLLIDKPFVTKARHSNGFVNMLTLQTSASPLKRNGNLELGGFSQALQSLYSPFPKPRAGRVAELLPVAQGWPARFPRTYLSPALSIFW